MSLLEFNNVSLWLPGERGEDHILDQISFALERGEFLAIVGESGSGKTMMTHMILRLLPHGRRMEGSILFGGQDLLQATYPQLELIRGKRIGLIFQEPMTALNPLHTIGRQISEAITIHQPLDNAALQQRLHELLDLVGLSNFHKRLKAYPHQLSGGERQRVMIAMALANNPDILIADEPTTALDVTTQRQILHLIKDLQQKLKMAVMFITHDLALVGNLADRTMVMKGGKIVEIAPTKTLFENPAHSYTKKLLDATFQKKLSPLPPSPKMLLEAENIHVSFARKFSVFGKVLKSTEAVDGVSLHVKEGETLGIVGESGSGKSTLAYAMLRLLKSRGGIRFHGQDMRKLEKENLNALRKRMQIVFQDPYSSLNPRMTVGEIIGEGLSVHMPHLTPEEREQRIQKKLEEVGLKPEFASRYPHAFSGGQRQRISIARALVLEPELVVLDEPTSALDRTLQVQILELLTKLQSKYRLSYLFISHDLRVVRSISHRVMVMHHGKIVEEGDTEQIFTSPQHGYTKMLIEAVEGL